MAIRISQTFAQIGIDVIPGKLDIETRNGELKIDQNPVEIDIETRLPAVIIDQYECFASAGLKNTLDLSREISQNARQKAMEYIAKTVDEGDRLAAIEKGGNPIAEIARRDSFDMHEYNVDYIPKARPKIDVIGMSDMDVKLDGPAVHNGVDYDYIKGNISGSYKWAKVDIYLKQRPSIDISFIGNNVDVRL